ncbi:histidine kinase [Hymenobacter sp. 15J16-1T3B]|uniref:ATP-binding protein n=1 Tax=Hymenobacter sp. 15J16-1T3B TaxID=2886941 RepID=UPI001D114736|nr:ATP-binding protein [Hymenobacter sp. 15J16-1T3B]MCC3157872.1 histidine kinase [Hymenobacter sp. 15J16-1T3B]
MLPLLLSLSSPAVAQRPGSRADSLLHLLAQSRPDTNRVELLIQLAWDRTDDNPVEAIRYGRRSLRLARQLNFPRGECRSLLMLGWAFLRAGDYPTAVHTQLQARQVAERAQFAGGLIHADNATGYAYAEQDNYNAAMRYYQRAKRLAEQKGDFVLLTPILGNIGQAFQHLGQIDSALHYTRRGYELDRRFHDWHSEIGDLALLGGMEAQRGDSAAARRYYQLCIRRAEGMPVSYALCRAYLGLARLAEANHSPDQALAYARQALRAGQRGYYPKGVFEASNYLAQVYAQRGDAAAAYRYLANAVVTRDSLFSQRKLAQVQALSFSEQLRQQELTEQHLKAEANRRQNLLLGALALTALSGGLLYLLLNRRRLQREVEFARERERLERQRLTAVLKAEENERRRIGSDLHDGLGQLLTAAKLNLHALNQQLHRTLDGQLNGNQTFIDNAVHVVDESFREVRSISHNLLPSALIKRGLPQAVSSFLNRLPASDLRVNVETYGLEERLDPTVESMLFRMIQELVQNVVKHAQATEMTLQLLRDEQQLTIVVTDNGVGFASNAPGANPGIGLRNVHTRMAYLGGRAHFDAAPGRGTTVTLEVPLPVAAG